ncbi:MAG: trigger factor [Eubacteriales bacterium]
MKITLKKNENCTSYFIVEINLDEIYSNSRKKARRAVVDANCASRDYGDEYVVNDEIIEEAIKVMMPTIIAKISKKQEIDHYIQPRIKIIQKNPILLEVIIALKPRVKLGDYKTMVVTSDSLEVGKEEINVVLEGLRNQFAIYNTVNRPVLKGDIVTIDISGAIQELKFIDKKCLNIQMIPESLTEIPSLYEKILGMQKGEEKEFKLKFPVDYNDKLVAGKDILFKVKVHDIQSTQLPELNDQFANKIVPGIHTLELLKERIKKNMELERKQNAPARYEEALIESLIKISELEYSPIMIDFQVQYILKEYKEQLRGSYGDNEEYEDKLKQLPEATLRHNATTIAKKNISWALVINELARLENIDVDYKEVDKEIEHLTTGLEEQEVYIDDESIRQNAYELLKAKKAINRLTEIVRINNKLEKQAIV